MVALNPPPDLHPPGVWRGLKPPGMRWVVAVGARRNIWGVCRIRSPCGRYAAARTSLLQPPADNARGDERLGGRLGGGRKECHKLDDFDGVTRLTMAVV